MTPNFKKTRLTGEKKPFESRVVSQFNQEEKIARLLPQ